MAALSNKENFITPKTNKTISFIKQSEKTNAHGAVEDSPFVIPASPLMKKLGCGTYITVYRYKRKQPVGGFEASPWAIKKAKKGRARDSIMGRLAKEGDIMRTLKHANIVSFKKLTTTRGGDMCLSMEDCGRSLDNIIHKHSEAEPIKLFTPRQIMSVTWAVANGLNYLHNEKHILHGDIKSGNVLIKRNFQEVKLADFGVSLYMMEDMSAPLNPNDEYIGSEPWHSKEVLDGGPITDKCDIFAYGLVIWEMLALDVPHVSAMHADVDSTASLLELSDDESCAFDVYYESLGTRPGMPAFEYSPMYDPAIGTFVCCTEIDSEKRPSARKLVQTLATVVDDYQLLRTRRTTTSTSELDTSGDNSDTTAALIESSGELREVLLENAKRPYKMQLRSGKLKL